ncbi:MAG TPA: DUF362 domain-containing protein [Spirochaetota bacterium]|nr:DUF362 domain-containing protein [Spirochaetota bacterium]HPC40057.1 DUF362 domain-containing protein [Spirochaetota bacterium]HPL15227.1 DUF362 domain-containing protein [Spirochaetota bacterium]HQF09937.1 DUF362 domain-containing protein [Spirochaetota bacterium]HQH98588.1 DUF362 domain-containing protein [Spirochaetota bacterium]
MKALQRKTIKPDTRVLIRRCEEYDEKAIREIVRQGMKDLGYEPSGKVFVKPNVVYATKNGKYGSTAFTHPALVSASLCALAGAPRVARVDMGEKTAIGYPTRLTYRYAGYYDLVRRARKKGGAKIGIFCIDEERRDRVFVGGAVHDTLRLSRRMARADSMVYLPKLKCHCVSSMTGAVKLNIGICSDDERSIRHDFLLNDKIADLLSVGYPDFIVMDAIDVGVGTEAVPTPRRLGLVIMGRNPLAVDLVGARLLGFNLEDVPYLQETVARGYAPARLKDVTITGDLKSVADLDRHARRVQPYDDEFYHWHDVEKELKRLRSPIRFYWGYSRPDKSRCKTGCIMAVKMYFAFTERFAGGDAFRKGKPAVMVVGRVDEEIDAKGAPVIMLGSCSKAKIVDAGKIIRIDSCTTTAVEMTEVIRGRLGIPTPLYAPSQIGPLAGAMLVASIKKLVNLRYVQDIGHFIKRGLLKRI